MKRDIGKVKVPTRESLSTEAKPPTSASVGGIVVGAWESDVVRAVEKSYYHMHSVVCPFFLLSSVLVSSEYGFSFRMVFFHLVTTGWFFSISYHM